MKNRKKMCIWLMVMILGGLMTACGGGAEVTTTLSETEIVSIEETTEEMTEPPTEAPTEPSTRQVDELKVGMIFYGEEGDGSLLADSLRREMWEAASRIGMREDQISWRYNSREADWTQIEESILACVDEGCQLILGCAREYEAVIAAIAEEYPEIMFACVGSSLYNGINSGTFSVDVGAAQYLCGAMAGLRTETDRVGFVAAKGTEDMMVTQAVNAFAYGVWSVNQEAVVDVAVIGKWFLPGAENHGREYLDDLGCDVIGSYTDSSLGSLSYQWDQYFAMKLSQLVGKEVVGEAWTGDLYAGAVSCEMSTELPEYVWEELSRWGVLMEGLPEETEASTEETEDSTEETVEQEAESIESVPEETQWEEVTLEETDPPYEIPQIDIDRETGYLPNVRIHKITWEE